MYSLKNKVETFRCPRFSCVNYYDKTYISTNKQIVQIDDTTHVLTPSSYTDSTIRLKDKLGELVVMKNGCLIYYVDKAILTIDGDTLYMFNAATNDHLCISLKDDQSPVYQSQLNGDMYDYLAEDRFVVNNMKKQFQSLFSIKEIKIEH